MNDSDSAERCHALLDDLLAVSDGRLNNIDRLLAEVQDQVDDLRGIFNPSVKTEQSRKKIGSGKFPDTTECSSI
jgi:hypothetical protein